MLEILLLRLDAPLMSFGTVVVDQHNVTGDFPLRSMVTGLLANALGHDHQEHERTSDLQRRLRLAARQDQAGERLVDFHTVDLGQDFLLEGWTTRGAPEGRRGGDAASGTHIRQRHYLADALYTLALTLMPADTAPTLDQLEAALREPERPLFLGRKACLPSMPLLLGRTRASSLREALQQLPPAARRHSGGEQRMLAWWPPDEGDTPDSRLVPVFEERDWRNRLHTGRRFVREGMLTLTSPSSQGKNQETSQEVSGG